MTDDEYMQEFCNKCKNRKRFEDICEIRKNIKGEPQCMNFEEEKTIEKEGNHIPRIDWKGRKKWK